MSLTQTRSIADQVLEMRNNAKGSRGHEAAAELIIAAFNGRFVPAFISWLHDPDEATPLVDHAAYASSGELRVLAFAEALMRPTKIDLADVFFVDNEVRALMLTAFHRAVGVA